MLVKVIFEKPYIFQKSIFKKMPPDTPRNRIRDLSGASLLVVKGFPKMFVPLHRNKIRLHMKTEPIIQMGKNIL